jgi:hypothetical protein
MKKNHQQTGKPRQDDLNKGSGAFNQGAEQDSDYNDGTKVTDEEKETGHTPLTEKKENPKDGNIGKNNAGGNK